ncbi:MAG TPA: alpha/beta hydrolase [Solirubrobacterales bacterium]
MERRRHELEGASGGRLVVEDAGPRDGAVLIFHGGTPGTGSIYEANLEAGAARGVRHVSYARPGYGGSDRHPGRTVGDCAADVAAIADQLGIERFFTGGQSGGGPHALACAALLSERVLAAFAVASYAPRGAESLDWLDGMAAECREEFAAAEAGERQLRDFLERLAPSLTGMDTGPPSDSLADLLGPVDRSLLNGDLSRHGATVMRAALEQGTWGWFDDDLALLADWGFDSESIQVPVAIWHGGDDRMVPFAHGRWLVEHVPGAAAHLFPEDGHLSFEVARYGEILEDLHGAAARSG